MPRIYLSPPDLGDREPELVLEAIESNWITTLGPQVDAFERELAEVAGVPHAVALSSGTAALHLALVVLGIGDGDEVACSDLTFAASANAIAYTGATPFFVDCDETWTIDPEPILEPGPEGSIDAGGLHWPSVVRTDDGYAMYYAAFDRPSGSGVIARATSPDGVTWTRSEEPVLAAELDWEQGSLDRPRVARTEDGYAMVYAGADLTDRGVAYSDDGVTWTRDGELPAITQDDFPVDGRSWDAVLVYRDGTLDYYLEIGSATASRGTQVYLASGRQP